MSLFTPQSKFQPKRNSSRFAGRRSRCVSRRGASVMVETALCMTLILLPLTLGILQFGVVLNASNQVEQISREGARFAAIHCGEGTFDDDENQANPPSLKYYLKNSVVQSKTGILWSDLNSPNGSIRVFYPASITSANPDGQPISGQGVSVKITYPMKRKLFIGSLTFNSKLGADNSVSILRRNYVATSTFVVE